MIFVEGGVKYLRKKFWGKDGETENWYKIRKWWNGVEERNRLGASKGVKRHELMADTNRKENCFKWRELHAGIRWKIKRSSKQNENNVEKWTVWDGARRKGEEKLRSKKKNGRR